MENKYFTKEEQQKAVAWLEEKWTDDRRNCECCGVDSWTISDDLIMPLRFIGGGLTFGGSTYPHFLIICNNCGNTKYFNAVVAGIVPTTVSRYRNEDEKDPIIEDEPRRAPFNNRFMEFIMNTFEYIKELVRKKKESAEKKEVQLEKLHDEISHLEEELADLPKE